MEENDLRLNNRRPFVTDDEIKERRKKYDQEHVVEIKEKNKTYYKKNKDVINERNKKYKQEHKDKTNELQRLNYRFNKLTYQAFVWVSSLS